MGLADVKLHGAQTGFLRCVDEFPAWKGELHGTQTHRNIQETTNLAWRKVKLHGTQTSKISSENGTKLWRRVKLHGSQINRAQYFLRTFLLERHKEIVGALVLTLSRGR